jgi:hypothetical protein
MPDNSRMEPQDPNAIPRLRASDADRDRAAEVINVALAEGRLTPDEHSERLDAIYQAKTQAELAPLLDDLPASSTGTALAVRPDAAVAPRRPSRIMAIFSGASRSGRWQAEPVVRVVTVFGGAELDFRDAVLSEREIKLRATAVLGGINVIVPPEMHVIDSGIAIMGGRQLVVDTTESLRPEAPVLHITGASILGGVAVQRRARDGIQAG